MNSEHMFVKQKQSYAHLRCSTVAAPLRTIGLNGWHMAIARASASGAVLNLEAASTSNSLESSPSCSSLPLAMPSFTMTCIPAECASRSASPWQECTLSVICFISWLGRSLRYYNMKGYNLYDLTCTLLKQIPRRLDTFKEPIAICRADLDCLADDFRLLDA